LHGKFLADWYTSMIYIYPLTLAHLAIAFHNC
jgi:hypothetical protein